MSTAMLRLFRLALRKTVPRPGAGNGGQPRVFVTLANGSST